MVVKVATEILHSLRDHVISMMTALPVRVAKILVSLKEVISRYAQPRAVVVLSQGGSCRGD